MTTKDRNAGDRPLHAAAVRLPVALTIAGSDSGGGAGIQADLKTFEALGVFGTSAITAITAQNTTGVRSVKTLEPKIVRDQIDAVVEDLHPGAAKTGMLASPAIIRTVAEAVTDHALPLVVDPVMVAKSGARLLEKDAEATLRAELVPRATLLTPNVPEAETLTGLRIDGPEAMEEAVARLLDLGSQAVLLKGGHLEGPEVVDLFHDGGRLHVLRKARVDSPNTHGTGCTLAAAIAAGLAKGLPLGKAVEDADRLLQRGVRYGLALGAGHGPVHHMAQLRDEAARVRVLDDLAAAVARFVDADAAAVVPEIGTNLAACTPYAMDVGDVAAVQGRLVRVRTPDGQMHVRAHGTVGFGASRHVAGLLLAVRQHDAEIGAAINLRYDEAVQAALDRLGWDVARFDRAEEPEPVKQHEGGTLPWAGHRVMRGREHAPAAVVDAGEVGKEPIVRLLGPTAMDVVARALALHAQLTTRPVATAPTAPDP